jgi:hypothetical protein
MTPQHLHATAALWSLRAVWPLLAQAAQRASGALGDDLGTVQAWRPGSGVHSGPAGDQILDAILRSGGSGANPYAERLARSGETIEWLSRHLVPPSPATLGEALRELTAAVPTLRPGTAMNLALHIGIEDRAVRRLLGERDDRREVPELRCPHCRTAGSLALRVSAPREHRTVVCTAGCACDGPGCGCGMATEVRDVAHIWTTLEIEEALTRCSPTELASDGEPPPRSRPTSAAA